LNINIVTEKKIDELLKTAESKLADYVFDELKTLIDKILLDCDKIQYQKGKANALRILGTIYGMKAENNQAKHILNEAYKLFNEVDDLYGNIKVNANMGIVLANLGEYEEALKHFHISVSFSYNFSDDKYLADQYVNIGSIYHKLGNFTLSFRYYKKALRIRQKLDNISGLATIYNNIANLYENQGDLGIALGYFLKAYKIWNTTSNPRAQAVVMYNIAVILNVLKNFSQAFQYFENALLLAIKYDIINIQALTYCSLANLLIEQDKFIQAEDYLSNAIKANEQSNDTETKKLILKTHIKYYKKINDYKKAFEYQKILIELDEKLRHKTISQKIASLEYDFNIKQKEKETELYRIKNIELRNAYNEIEKKSQALIEANENLKQLDASKDAILSIVSHDIKNLIGSIYSIIELFRYEKLNSKSENYINMIETSVQKALKLVQDILEANALETRDYKLNLNPYDFNELLSSYKSSFKINAEAKMINFKMILPQNSCLVYIQIDRFWQIIENLISNAIKFSKQGGFISITGEIITENNKSFALIKIKDTGIGISKENIPIIFNKFTLAKRKGTKGEMTTGLGLSIVKRLVELHYGEISVKSEINVGSEFIVKLPAYEKAVK